MSVIRKSKTFEPGETVVWNRELKEYWTLDDKPLTMTEEKDVLLYCSTVNDLHEYRQLLSKFGIEFKERNYKKHSTINIDCIGIEIDKGLGFYDLVCEFFFYPDGRFINYAVCE